MRAGRAREVRIFVHGLSEIRHAMTRGMKFAFAVRTNYIN
jgi:hypothetical protein